MISSFRIGDFQNTGQALSAHRYIHLTYVKSDLVDAPVINELPIALECEFVEYQSDATGIGVIGKVLRTSVEEANVKDGKVDIDSVEAIAFDPYTHGYYKCRHQSGRCL